jgi:heptosyltransferase-3
MTDYKRILVIKLKQPGDVLLSVPVLAALKEAWPQARVTYLVPRGAHEMVADHPLLDGLLVVNRRQESWGGAWRLIRELRRRRFDLVLELSGGDRGAFHAWLTGAPTRMAFDRRNKPFWWSFCITRVVPPPPHDMHMVRQNLEMLRGLGLSPQNPRLEFFWPPQVEERVRELLASLGLAPGGFVVMHPGAGWRFKCWTPAGYARVIERLMEQEGLPVVLTGTRAAHEQELLTAILSQCRASPVNLAGKLSLKELGALMSRARFFFGVDSAPMHLAAAVGTRTVALFGPTGAYNWSPWGPGHLVIQKEWDCIGCGQDGCKGSKVSRCLEEITPEEVLDRMAEQGFEGSG